MFVYEKKLQYPVRIARPDPKMASRIISQYGGPDGELGASLRYLSQRFTMPCGELKGLLTDIGVEELGHLEIVGAMIQQLTRNLSCDDITKAGFDAYFVDHGIGVYPTAAGGYPYQAAAMQSKGDAITDLHEDIAADAAITQEQQAPKTGLKNGRNTNVGTSFLTHCSQMKEPPSAQAVRRLFCVSRVKMAEEGWLAHKGLKRRV
ncbi:MAG: manganese catalase family protein [Clostridia bacterium]|nr:manganese catalase family protein [Clostridia bacterium]